MRSEARRPANQRTTCRRGCQSAAGPLQRSRRQGSASAMLPVGKCFDCGACAGERSLPMRRCLGSLYCILRCLDLARRHCSIALCVRTRRNAGTCGADWRQFHRRGAVGSAFGQECVAVTDTACLVQCLLWRIACALFLSGCHHAFAPITIRLFSTNTCFIACVTVYCPRGWGFPGERFPRKRLPLHLGFFP